MLTNNPGKEDKVVKAMQKRANHVSSNKELLAVKTKDWERIKEYMNNAGAEIRLTTIQQNKLDRYQYIFHNRCSGLYTHQEVINQTVKKFNVKLVQVYEDLNYTFELYTSVIKFSKRFELMAELESARDLKRKCIIIGEFAAAAMFGKNIIALFSQLESQEGSPGDLFEGHHFEVTFDPRLLSAPDINMKEILDIINAKRKVKIKTNMFEELQYEPSALAGSESDGDTSKGN